MTVTATTTGEQVTLELAQFVARLRFDNLNGEITTRAKQHILDGLGNQIAASVISRPARIVHDLYRDWGGRGEATVVGYGTRLPAPMTAMVNAMMGHGVELDDAHGRGLIKGGSVFVSVANVVGEMTAAPGTELIAALVTGYEVGVRVALAANPSHRKRGFHATGTAGTFGAAAITAKLLGLDAERTAWALGLAGVQAAGIQAFLDDPCMAKPMSPGKAAMNGVLAGVLAHRGFTGPRYVLEGAEGWFHAFSDQFDIGRVTKNLGSEFMIMEVAFKPHAACRYAHGPIDNAQAIGREGQFDYDDIETIEVGLSDLAIRQSGRKECTTLNSAMGSTAFGVALALTRGRNGLNEYWDGFKDPLVHSLAGRVVLVRDAEAGEMGRQSWVRVRLRDGRDRFQASALPKGEPLLPMSSYELLDKFRGLGCFALDPDQVQAIIGLVEGLEGLPDSGALNRATVARRRREIDPLA
jgi:2-methylcitrate dehydratase PrpD